MNLLERILSTDFMPHGFCFLWDPAILWLHVTSDALIALAYFAIPVTLVVFAARRGELPFPWLFLLFATFIICCGTTHLMEIWTVWNPDYGAAGLVKAVCAFFSVTTAAAMIPVVPKALALRSPRELEAVNLRLAEEAGRHAATAGALARAHDELEARVRERTAALSARTAELAASEARYRALVEAMASVVWRTDAAGLVGDMPDWRAITGQSVAEVRGWGWLDAVHPEDRGPTRDAWLRAVEGGAVYETEYRTRTRDGAWRWYAVRGVPVRDADGTAREWVGVCIDIDERKRAEAELRESEERYRTLVDTAPDAVFVHQDRTVVLANREAVALFGAADAAELVGRPVEDLIDPDSLPLALERIARLTEPGQRNELAEMRYRRLDGTPSPVEVASAAVPVGGRLAVQVAFRDIGVRKAAEAHQHLLVQELAHRVKNTLAVVQGIAARSLADGRPLAEARDALMRRLRALASAHTLLLESGWRGASLRALAETLLAPYGQQVAVSGEDVTLTPRAALTLSMVLHELATNAAKHGALSAPEGRVAVGWEAAGPPGATSLSLSWRETAGPPVALPARRGFGRVLIEQAVAHELGGRARLEFGPQGVSYALEADLAPAA